MKPTYHPYLTEPTYTLLAAGCADVLMGMHFPRFHRVFQYRNPGDPVPFIKACSLKAPVLGLLKYPRAQEK